MRYGKYDFLTLWRYSRGVASEEGGADSGCVWSERGGHYFCGFKTRLERAALRFLNHRVQDYFARLHHAATEHNPFNVQQVNHARHTRADIFAGALQHHQRKIVAFSRLSRHIIGSEVFI